MKYKIKSIEFETTAQGWRDGQFSIPKEIATITGIDNGHSFKIMVLSPQGESSHTVNVNSGLEVYHFPDSIKASDIISIKIDLSNVAAI